MNFGSILAIVPALLSFAEFVITGINDTRCQKEMKEEIKKELLEELSSEKK